MQRDRERKKGEGDRMVTEEKIIKKRIREEQKGEISYIFLPHPNFQRRKGKEKTRE